MTPDVGASRISYDGVPHGSFSFMQTYRDRQAAQG